MPCEQQLKIQSYLRGKDYGETLQLPFIYYRVFSLMERVCFILCDTRGKILGGGFCAMSEKLYILETVKFSVNQSNQCEFGAPLIQREDFQERNVCRE